MHVRLEELAADTQLLREIQGLLLHSGRCQPGELPKLNC